MAAKRNLEHVNDLEGNEKRPRRLSNDVLSNSPATSDLFESDMDVLEETESRNKEEETLALGESLGSPSTSDLFEQISERHEAVASPLNTSELFEPLLESAEKKGSPTSIDGRLSTSQDSEDDIGCFPLEESDNEERPLTRGKSEIYISRIFDGRIFSRLFLVSQV